ncbi:mitochondrial import receptor subunit Tom22 [Exophiala xenobiotica]|uniref:Mitochondrial import receptor subunit Tom22 n=1 Tax=Lithohypha guttulata TaxID=1690604 RepID=A0ABR0KBR6_9EURO|nr:mitochondrial import receptor subunit Tom22 [Lithohypha guttulata]KAK5319788.1 mitochondrial import receptor subunit Tom22 [Exophiala xenobiotica]
MVRLEEVEDETFVEKPSSAGDEVLLADDDADYTDTDSEISDSESLSDPTPDESLADRLTALRDIIPPQTRAKLTSTLSTTYNGAAKTVTFGGKSLWVICTSVLLLGLPYALAFQDEQMVQEEERQRQLMSEGASGLMSAGQEGGQQGQAKAAL